MTVLVTGGSGFIGSALIRHLLEEERYAVVNLDKLTYAGSTSVAATRTARYRFVQGDICDAECLAALFREVRPDAVIHLAAESHVDRSLDGPAAFVRTNIVGTFTLLQQALAYFRTLPRQDQDRFRFHHVSTDEVFGSLGAEGRFRETTAYDPRSPYSASKAASDHLVRAWGHSYGLPILVTNCSNNYGPYQFPEKLIPLMIIKALAGEPLPVYGDGRNIRDWLFVEDHVRALRLVVERGEPGETYAIGGDAERTNIEVVTAVCQALDGMAPRPDRQPYAAQIRFVEDRPGHDRRYAIDAGKIGSALGWTPTTPFETGITRTVRWYLENRAWWGRILRSTDATARRGVAPP
ncbi:MAG: dTDP-glucose 4,6-dehydratase [Rhizobiaceae bacterium]|nr:dTDP-glucose 4,6-dehydratase [Rhizobiaceae bacterium]